MDDKEEILEQLREGLKNCQEYYKSDGGYNLTSAYDDCSFANVTIGNEIQTTFNFSNLTNTLSNITASTVSVSPSWLGANGTAGTPYIWEDLKTSSGKITLSGPEADVEINGKSLMSIIDRIEERLNILEPNKKLEQEWSELKQLGEQYRALEKKLIEQGKMWEALKKVPTPKTK